MKNYRSTDIFTGPPKIQFLSTPSMTAYTLFRPITNHFIWMFKTACHSYNQISAVRFRFYSQVQFNWSINRIWLAHKKLFIHELDIIVIE